MNRIVGSPGRAGSRLFALLAALLLPLAVGCGASKTPAVPESPPERAPPRAAREENLLAILKPSGAPIWFEFGDPFPGLIPYPEDAALLPFAPWPYVRHGADIAFWEGSLVLAVNNTGFLVFRPHREGLGLYGINQDAWKPYGIASVFSVQGDPAALLFRDDFFALEGDRPAPPAAPVWVLEGLGRSGLNPRDIPALAPLPPGEGWNVEELSLGRDGLWHFRGSRSSESRRESRYFHTKDLGVSGEETSPGVFRNGTAPYTIDNAPALLRRVMEEAGKRRGNLIIGVASPDFPTTRHFRVAGDTGDPAELSGFWLDGEEPRAAALFPDGLLFYGKGDAEITSLSLPPLPEGFVYTRLGKSGPALVAVWEERDNWNIGAAGFMAIAEP